jgi:hypothetical protein
VRHPQSNRGGQHPDATRVHGIHPPDGLRTWGDAEILHLENAMATSSASLPLLLSIDQTAISQQTVPQLLDKE